MVLGFTTLAGLAIHAQAVDPAATSRFLVTLRGVRIGTEVVTVTRTPSLFTISARGQIAPPIDLITGKFEMTYGPDWQPQRLTIEGALRNQALSVGTTFGLTTAMNDVVQGTSRGSISHEISPRTVVLPPNFIAAYEVLAARLSSFQTGVSFPVYIAPEGEIKATVNRITPRRVVSPEKATDLREYDITLLRPGVPLSVVVWVDERNRLAKVVFGDQGFAAIREDLSTVRSREELVRNPGDSDLFIPASGFSLAATMTMPAKRAAKMPAVVLVGGQGRQDREETKYGVAIFGQMAGLLADAGFIVVRFDKRGVGQSGGRPEHAGVAEYGQDVANITAWLRKRKDVDQNRISLVSHADGSAFALTAAAIDSKIRGVALLSAPGFTGRDTVLRQQHHTLARMVMTPADRDARIALQARVIDAVITGKGWDTIPPDIRRSVDTIWYKTWLLFDPAVALKKVKQPLLILHGALDREMPPPNGDRLTELSKTRKNSPPAATVNVIVPGVNHLLLPAVTGEPDEYDTLVSGSVSPAVISALVTWLHQPVK